MSFLQVLVMKLPLAEFICIVSIVQETLPGEGVDKLSSFSP